MTVNYSAKIATRKYWTFFRLLKRWRGSVFKAVWLETLVYGAIYATISVLYRLALSPLHRHRFEKLCLFCARFNSLIPLAFILGFYVTLVVHRWWEHFLSLPWPDAVALNITAYLQGNSAGALAQRRTIARYLNLALVMCLRSVATGAKRRFPTMETLVGAGLLTGKEYELLAQLEPKYKLFFVPLVWAAGLVTRAREERLIREDPQQNIIILSLTDYGRKLQQLFNFDWVSVPLVYTQVTTIAVYTYFLSTLFGNQFLDPAKGDPGASVDCFVPVFGLLHFVFYLGWLKVAESLVNPMGDDDEDFDINYLIDRNLVMCDLLVNALHQEQPPELVRDAYWDLPDVQLPYTEETQPPVDKVGTFMAGSVRTLFDDRGQQQLGVGVESLTSFLRRKFSLTSAHQRRQISDFDLDEEESDTQISSNNICELSSLTPTEDSGDVY